MIYVSTGGVRDRTAAAVAAGLLGAGVDAVELSGGAYSETLLADLQALSTDIKFQIHNYFPPPADPFVLNLGSLDNDIGGRSVNHVLQAIRWCQVLGSERYSFHAGFLLDPRVNELGQRIPSRQLFEREASIDAFVSRVSFLAAEAEKAGIELMIENNVLSANNAKEFPANPLLMCDPDECHRIMHLVPDSVGLLVDVAHLKVSANSLGFEPAAMFSRCNDRIVAYHLSDNNGLSDSNQSFSDDAWFWPYLKRDVTYFSVEVYDMTPDELFQQVQLVRSKLQATTQSS